MSAAPETENQLLRLALTACVEGADGADALARFALGDTDAAALAVAAYECQQRRVVEAATAFLQGGGEDTGPLQREIDAILKLRGADSHRRCSVRDVRGPRRRR